MTPKFKLRYAIFLTDVVRNERLDTVEEVSEPVSSDFMLDSLPLEGADNALRFGSSGNTSSSEFQQDSLPPDNPNANGI